MIRWVKLLRVARPQFLMASLVLFTSGVAWAMLLGASFSWPRIGLGYLIILPVQLAVSYCNDYFDVAVDQLGSPSLFSGGSGVLVKYPELRKPALRIAIGLMACSLILGILFLVLFSYPLWFLIFILVSYLLSWFYSAPPLKLAYRGLGELVTAFFLGCLVPGMGYWVTRGYFDRAGLLFSPPLMLYGLTLMLAVEIPDEEADRLGHKQTWVARMGRRFGFIAMAALLLAATSYFFWISDVHPTPAASLDFRVLGYFSLLPLGIGLLGLLKRPADRHTAILFANSTVVGLVVFFILMDIYLLFALTQ